MQLELVGTNEIHCKELWGSKERKLQCPEEGHLQLSPSRASLLMGKGLDTDITETVSKCSAWNFKSIHRRTMPVFKNLTVKALNKGQGKTIFTWFNKRSLPLPHFKVSISANWSTTGNCEGGVCEEMEGILMCSPFVRHTWICMWIFLSIIWPYWRGMWFTLTWWQSHWDTSRSSLEENPKFGFCSREFLLQPFENRHLGVCGCLVPELALARAAAKRWAGPQVVNCVLSPWEFCRWGPGFILWSEYVGDVSLQTRGDLYWWEGPPSHVKPGICRVQELLEGWPL